MKTTIISGMGSSGQCGGIRGFGPIPDGWDNDKGDGMETVIISTKNDSKLRVEAQAALLALGVKFSLRGDDIVTTNPKVVKHLIPVRKALWAHVEGRKALES